jgi:glycine reductase
MVNITKKKKTLRNPSGPSEIPSGSSMKLDLQNFLIRDIQFGDKTEYSKGVLFINKKELVDLISEDRRIKRVDIQVAHPGEGVRITNILEISEPRIKDGNEDGYYPGIFGRLVHAGQGKTNVLRGSAVLEIGGMPGFYGGVVDMTGKGALLTPYSKTHNICLCTEPASKVERIEYGLALKQAGLKTSVYLAKMTKGMDPDEVKVFDLSSPSKRLAGLPRIGYLFLLHSHGDSREPFIYGDNSRRYYPTLLHPNEILDGAIVCGHYNISVSIKNTTFALLNHPVILDLYERHGKELNFRGVVIAPEPTSLSEIRRIAMMSASLFKNFLNADGVIITKEGGGHTDVDLMQTCEQCEQMGIKTVLIDNEWLGPDGTGDLSLLASSQNADAMISVGNVDGMIDLPPMDKIIGGNTLLDVNGDLQGKLNLPIRFIPNAISQVGLTYLTTEEE